MPFNILSREQHRTLQLLQKTSVATTLLNVIMKLLSATMVSVSISNMPKEFLQCSSDYRKTTIIKVPESAWRFARRSCRIMVEKYLLNRSQVQVPGFT